VGAVAEFEPWCHGRDAVPYDGVILNTMLRLTPVALFLLALAGLPALAADDKPTRPVAVGERFPTLTSEFLTGRTATLPDAAQGKVALIMMGFSYDSRFVVERWAEEFSSAFGTRADVTFFQVPVIGGMGRLAKWFIDSGMRKGTPTALHENVITVYGGVDRWKTLMGFTRAGENDAYLTLIDQTGRVVWVHHGAFDTAAFETLRAEIGRAILRLPSSTS
jgi:hypothetical protein